MDARKHLINEHSTGNAPEITRLKAMLHDLKQMVTIRRIYVTLEIVTPVAFAIFAILYVLFR
jgi:hypothetical protein